MAPRGLAGAGGNGRSSPGRHQPALRLPLVRARLPAAKAAPATKAGPDAPLPLHWPRPCDVMKERRGRGGRREAAMATAVNTREAGSLAQGPSGPFSEAPQRQFGIRAAGTKPADQLLMTLAKSPLVPTVLWW